MKKELRFIKDAQTALQIITNAIQPHTIATDPRDYDTVRHEARAYLTQYTSLTNATLNQKQLIN